MKNYDSILGPRRRGRPATLLEYLGEVRSAQEWAEFTGIPYGSISYRYRQRRINNLAYSDGWVIFGGEPARIEANQTASFIRSHGVTSSIELDHLVRFLTDGLEERLTLVVQKVLQEYTEDKVRPTLSRLLDNMAARSKGHEPLVPLVPDPVEEPSDGHKRARGRPATCDRGGFTKPKQGERPSALGEPYKKDPDPRDGEMIYSNATFLDVRKNEGDTSAEAQWAYRDALLQEQYWAAPAAPAASGSEAESEAESVSVATESGYPPDSAATKAPPPKVQIEWIRRHRHQPDRLDRIVLPNRSDFFSPSESPGPEDQPLPPPGWNIIDGETHPTPVWWEDLLPGFSPPVPQRTHWPQGYHPGGAFPRQEDTSAISRDLEDQVIVAPWWEAREGFASELPGGHYPVSQYDRLAAWAHTIKHGRSFSSDDLSSAYPAGRRDAALARGNYTWAVDNHTLLLALDAEWAWVWLYRHFHKAKPIAGRRWDSTLEALSLRLPRWLYSKTKFVREYVPKLIREVHKDGRQELLDMVGWDELPAVSHAERVAKPTGEGREEIFLPAADLLVELSVGEQLAAIKADTELAREYKRRLKELRRDPEWDPVYPQFDSTNFT